MVSEYRFHPTRKWRFDFAWPDVKVAIEIQGGGYARGRHTRGAGQEADFEKLNEAQRLGWVVLQFGPSQLASHRKTRVVIRYVSDIIQERSNAISSSGPKISILDTLCPSLKNIPSVPFKTRNIYRLKFADPTPTATTRRSAPVPKRRSKSSRKV